MTLPCLCYCLIYIKSDSYLSAGNHRFIFIILFCRYKMWLPDNVVGRHDTKTTYQVEIRYANNTNETFTFHGPPGKNFEY